METSARIHAYTLQSAPRETSGEYRLCKALVGCSEPPLPAPDNLPSEGAETPPAQLGDLSTPVISTDLL